MKEESRHHESSDLLFKNSSTTHSLLTKAGDLMRLILNVTDGADIFITRRPHLVRYLLWKDMTDE